MNSLSWMIYAADVLDNIGGVLFLVGFFGLVGGAITLAGSVYEAETRRVVLRRWFPVCTALVVFAAILPSKETVYAIAASEMGEEALKSETASKAFKALDAWLDRQIAG